MCTHQPQLAQTSRRDQSTTQFADQILPATTNLPPKSPHHPQTQPNQPLFYTIQTQTQTPIFSLLHCGSSVVRYKREAKWEFLPCRSIA
ncbi:hypothetical protein Csa_023100 [Cucumis sativus]|uniref:Uncharacterized protein n=1 Tax=Cucumis sativus TaxID=3659 RepID=A0A0A0KMT8_CUCSA|nr:hypothetical protein Csa_023100 [Cucumis sativus]